MKKILVVLEFWNASPGLHKIRCSRLDRSWRFEPEMTDWWSWTQPLSYWYLHTYKGQMALLMNSTLNRTVAKKLFGIPDFFIAFGLKNEKIMIIFDCYFRRLLLYWIVWMFFVMCLVCLYWLKHWLQTQSIQSIGLFELIDLIGIMIPIKG